MFFYDVLDLLVVPARFHTVPDLWGALDRFLAVPLLFGAPFLSSMFWISDAFISL